MTVNNEQSSLELEDYEHEVEEETIEKEMIEEENKENNETEKKSPKEEGIQDDSTKENDEIDDLIDEMAKDIEDEDGEYIHKGADGTLYTERQWNRQVHVNGPTRKEIEGWKEKYGVKKISMIVVGGDIFVFRTLKRPEYREVLRNQELTALDREEVFSEKCTLYPYNFSTDNDEFDAGIYTILSDAIIDRSGFTSTTGIIRL